MSTPQESVAASPPPTAASPLSSVLDPTVAPPRRILWLNVLNVVSVAILIGAEVFGISLLGGWAIGHMLGIGPWGEYAVEGVLTLGGLYLMWTFVRVAVQVEPFIGPST